MFPDTSNEGTLILSCWCYLDTWRECEIITADATTQTAKVEIRHAESWVALVPFTKIESVCLKWSRSNRIEQYFGRPRTHRPESLAFIRGYQHASI